MGQFDKAREIVADLRSRFGDGRSGRVTIWIMLVEGMIHWYADLSPVGLDRVTRAQLLSTAMKYDTGIAVSSAWKGYIEFESSNFNAMFPSLELSILHASASDHEARARVAVVMASAHAISGDIEGAKVWFMRGRDHALKDGDQASIEALQYNRAALTLAWARAENCIQKVDSDFVRRLRIELNSTKGLLALTGIQTLENHVNLCDARLRMLERDWQGATEGLRQVRGAHPFAPYHFSYSLIDLEIAYCIFKLGKLDEALDQYRIVDFAAIGDLHLDEQLVITSIRQEMAAADDRFGDGATFGNQLSQLAVAHIAWQDSLRQGLLRYSSLFGQKFN
jgi:hypothetical protein